MSRRVEPRPLPQHVAKTVFVRVPTHVWPMVSMGRVAEFRHAIGNAPQLWKVPLPTLCVVYRRQKSTPHLDYRLMTLEGVRREALGAISEEGLRLAGYAGEAAFARFRRDWMIMEKRRFEPLRSVFVYTVRPVRDGDLAEAGAALVHHLYEEYVATAVDRARTARVA